MIVKNLTIEEANNENADRDSGSRIKARVQYFGSVRALTKRGEEEVEIPSNATVQELLKSLSSLYGEAFESEVFEGEEKNLREDLMVAINGTLADHAVIMDTRIKSGDVFTLFPIFLGGG